jgi:hypothetical protein
MIVSIHQPEYLPWLGFFHKVHQSNIFVLLDNVQYEKNYFQNRNKIRTQSGWTWLTVPVLTKGKSNQQIKEVEIDNKTKWSWKHWRSIDLNYKKTPYFDNYRDFFYDLYKKEWIKLVDLNETIITYLIKELGMDVKLIKSSELNIEGKGTELLLSICKILNADVYLSGRFGKDYLVDEQFHKNGIKVIYQEFKHPTYTQLFKPFIPNMSVIDLIFNHGEKSLNIIEGIIGDI